MVKYAVMGARAAWEEQHKEPSSSSSAIVRHGSASVTITAQHVKLLRDSVSRPLSAMRASRQVLEQQLQTLSSDIRCVEDAVALIEAVGRDSGLQM